MRSSVAASTQRAEAHILLCGTPKKTNKARGIGINQIHGKLSIYCNYAQGHTYHAVLLHELFFRFMSCVHPAQIHTPTPTPLTQSEGRIPWLWGISRRTFSYSPESLPFEAACTGPPQIYLAAPSCPLSCPQTHSQGRVLMTITTTVRKNKNGNSTLVIPKTTYAPLFPAPRCYSQPRAVTNRASFKNGRPILPYTFSPESCLSNWRRVVIETQVAAWRVVGT